MHLEKCFSCEACHSLKLWKVHFKKTIEELWQAELDGGQGELSLVFVNMFEHSRNIF